MLKKITVGLLSLVLAQSEILPFNNDAIEKVFQKKSPALFLFTKNNQESTAAKQALKALDESGEVPEGVYLTLSDSEDGFGLFDRLAEYLGVDTSQTPQILFLGSKAQKYKFDQEEITQQTLGSFVNRVQSGQVQPFLKSAPVPESNDQPVKVIVGSTFKQLVLDSEKEVLVKFYAPWCGHCKTLAPHYQKAAEKLSVNPNIMIAKVDSTQNEVADMDIQGFPTLKFFGKDKSAKPIEFNGGRTTEGIIQWLKEHTEYDWVDIEEEAQPKQEQGQL